MGDKVPDHGSILSIWIIPKKNFLKNKFKKSNIVVWPCSVCLVYFVKMPTAVSISAHNSVVRSSDQNMPVRPDISYPKESKERSSLRRMFVRFARSVRTEILSTHKSRIGMMRRERVSCNVIYLSVSLSFSNYIVTV